jgi:hypothetical protein
MQENKMNTSRKNYALCNIEIRNNIQPKNEIKMEGLDKT